MKIITRPVYRLLNMVIYIIDCLYPRKKNLWVFQLGRDNLFNGNIRALWDHIKTENDIDFEITCFKGNDKTVEKITGKKCIKTNSIKGLLLLFKARVLIIQHARNDFFVFGITDKRRVIINLWHGIPIKGLRYTSTSSYNNQQKNFRKEETGYSAIICSSLVDKLAMSACFNLPYSKFFVTGLPRNDWMKMDIDQLPAEMRAEYDSVKSLAGDRKLVLYAPTFRNPVEKKYTSGVYSFSPDQIELLNNLLEENNAVLGLRTHDYFIKYRDNLYNNKRIIDLGSDKFSNVQMVLRAADLLITDYSSLWLDYLLAEKPVIGFTYDYDDYMKDRGLIYEYRDIFPGPLANNFEELITAINEVCSNNFVLKSQLFDYSRKMFYKHTDCGSSKRVANLIRQLTD
ncbi:MAG: CDP-glycerol glycerophosphotransferase family protein [Spirochaetes bacterium]|nr:CDP-glycerol glycerophosphotransferase family protein [Spirochaetota bacterium]MBN2770629.1 CDP-glycerol glycerophosphotransferase family protein [Spirochaetota bacterium]